MNKNAGIYIHVPFCVKKCAYCDFVSFPCSQDVQERYFDALNLEINKKSESFGKIPVDSVFFGGGTPSLVDAGLIYKTLSGLRDSFSFSDDTEITIEANPDSVTAEKLKIYKEAGINRISMGLQSADDEELKLLSRVHDYGTFLRAYDMVRSEGFDNVNIDLIGGLPGQTSEKFAETLNKVTALRPGHISAYSLIIEEGTEFYNRYGGESPVPEETDREIYHMTASILGDAGYERYEISNYAIPGHECRHNIKYWDRTPYLGFGIAAASFYGDIRYSHEADLMGYIGGNFSEKEEILSETDGMEEFMFLGLRMTRGVSKKEFLDTFNVSMESEYGDVLDKLSKEGLIENGERVRFTERGLDLANYCMSEFIH